MDNMLKGLFGGGDDAAAQGQQAQASDFANRYLNGNPNEGYSKDEALQHFQRVAQTAPPDVLQRAAEQTVQNLPPDQRAEFNQMLQQRQQGQGMVPIQGAAETTGVQQGSGGGGALGSLFGGLLGGGGLGGLLGGGGGGGNLGNLGGLFGGGANTQPSAQTGAGTSGGGNPLGDLINSPLGKVLLGGIAAFALKDMMNRK